MRRNAAAILCLGAQTVAVILGLIAGLGVSAATIILMVNGTLKVGVGLAILFLGLPLIEGVFALLNGVIGTVLVSMARFFDGAFVEEWLLNQDM